MTSSVVYGNAAPTTTPRQVLPVKVTPTTSTARPVPTTSARPVNVAPAATSTAVRPPAASVSASQAVVPAGTSSPAPNVPASATAIDEASQASATDSQGDILVDTSASSVQPSPGGDTASSPESESGESAAIPVSQPLASQVDAGDESILPTSFDTQDNGSPSGNVGVFSTPSGLDGAPGSEGNHNDGPGLAVGTIVGIACGTFFAVVLVLAACWWYRKHLKQVRVRQVAELARLQRRHDPKPFMITTNAGAGAGADTASSYPSGFAISFASSAGSGSYLIEKSARHHKARPESTMLPAEIRNSPHPSSIDSVLMAWANSAEKSSFSDK